MRDTSDPAIQPTLDAVFDRLQVHPRIALVLGSGLGGFADRVEEARTLPTSEIPGYPRSTVAGHAGRLVAGRVEGVEVLVMQGRVHFYEGYPMEQVVLPVRLAAALGAEALVLTNAAGGVGEELAPGDLMAITDHVNLMGTNPLIGQSWGFDRFPDMSRAWDPDLTAALRGAAEAESIELKRGVLGAWTGPTYETASEVKLLRQIGVDAACMSTVPEAIAAARLRLRTCGVSCITNYATGVTDQPLSHDEVQETADRVAETFQRLLTAAIPAIAAHAAGTAEEGRS
jgi:purine-nucleoside phosphorylase